MKKKLLVLMLATTMVLSAAGCGAKQAETTPAATEEKKEEAATEEKKEEAATEEKKTVTDYQYIAPEEAVKAAGDGKTHVLDVREWSNYVAGRVANSEWKPIFPLEDTSLEAEMKKYGDEHLKDGEKIYIICNSGKKGAEKTTKILVEECGIDQSLIFTVEGGAKALAEVKDALTTNRYDEKIDWQYATGKDVLAMTGAQIVDVRDADTYAAGHLKDTINVALKEVESADAQTAMYEKAKDLDSSKPVYFLCYSGNKCAKTAISILKDAGFPEKNLYIIKDGAKDSDISAAFVK